MGNDFIFTQFADVRSRTVTELEGITEGEMDVLHEGFNNSIRWNFGHICTIAEKLAFKFNQNLQEIPAEFNLFFDGGTSPRQWETIPPSRDTIVKVLIEQPNRIKKSVADRLDEKISEPIVVKTGLKMETVREILGFLIYHEGVHLGVIKSLKHLK